MNFQVGLQRRGDISRQKYRGVWECVLVWYWWAFCRAALISINSTRLPWKRTFLKELGRLGVNINGHFHSQWVFCLWSFSISYTHKYRCLSASSLMYFFYIILRNTNWAYHKVHFRLVLRISIYGTAVIVCIERGTKKEMFVLLVDNRLTYIQLQSKTTITNSIANKYAETMFSYL